jgi:hypothetical protein
VPRPARRTAPSSRLPKSRRNSGKAWSPTQVRQLRKLASGNTPTGVIGLKLGRSKPGVSSKASSLGISLKPTNQSPYNRRRKK